MINLSTSVESSAVDNSKESLYPKTSRGKVRLPPLPTRQLTRYTPQQDTTILTGHERKPLFSCSPNLSSPFITENLLTPTGDYKCPRSPSNLSLQFNFEEPRHAKADGPFEEKTDRVKVVSKSGQKIVKRSMPKTSRNRRSINMKPKGYNILNNEESMALEKPIESKEKRSSTIGETSAAGHEAQTNSRNGKMPKSRGLGAKPSAERSLRVETTKNKERKGSTYDLREFLSLATDTQHRINSSSRSKTNIVRHEKKPVKLSPKPKSSDDCTYDLFEFLALSAESSRHLTRSGQKNKKETQPQKSAKGKLTKSTKNLDIPSVIVADWSLNEDTPRTELLRQSRELPKANFPSDDFPRRNERHPTLDTSKKSGQRNSVYDLKEFLMLPDAVRRRSIKKVSPQPQDTKLRSNSLEADTNRELDVKYDLGEFLNFLEAGGGGLQVNTTGLERSVGELRSRSLSVYDIYEFLKTSNTKDLSTGVECAGINQSKPSVIDVTSLVAKSSLNTKEENTSHASSYNLREFLTLPVTVESNGNELQNSKSKTEQ